MTYVVDTCVLSDLKRGSRHPELLSWWFATPPDQLLIPAVVISEIHYGIVRLRLRGRIAEADDNDRWLQGLRLALPIIPYDDRIATIHAELSAAVTHDGTPSFERDLMIAATAVATRSTMVTRNLRHFSATAAVFGFRLLNPYNEPFSVAALSG
ncbi:PIN domain-containing protein [Nitrospirillum viridazoti]|uniref:PIN domain-containing protein n=1 Tax=Nitrospirillum viridazoti TaxID=3144925 RepID=UPI0006800677|nr:PIN domain-containing protein [Nitrospirillum amazonense]